MTAQGPLAADAARPEIAGARRVVVKVGSSSLTTLPGGLDIERLAALVDVLGSARTAGREVVLVSSGAIAAGLAPLGLEGRPRDLATAQAAASVGQLRLVQTYADAFARHGITVGQVLLTADDLTRRGHYRNAHRTVERLLTLGALPIVNENDTVATEEIRFGDNDRLAARVAQAASADAVVLMSDVEGLYDRHPREPGAVLIERVDGVTAEILAMASADSGSGLGRGGMAAKVEAARIAERAGIALAIIDGTGHAPLAKALDAGRGTLFLPQRDEGSRKAWLGGRLTVAGVLGVDEGCVAALGQGASLLAAGLSEVEGDFVRGDLVAIHGPKGERLGQGLVEYASHECRAILGLREAEQEARLGYTPRAAVIHRDHMVRA